MNLNKVLAYNALYLFYRDDKIEQYFVRTSAKIANSKLEITHCEDEVGRIVESHDGSNIGRTIFSLMRSKIQQGWKVERI